MEFKIGDRVKYVVSSDPIDNPDIIPTYGTVKDIKEKNIAKYGVEWDENIDGHTCFGTCLDYHGWYCKAEQLELVVDPNPHYQATIQPIEVMQANMTHEEFIGFLKGNIIKYVCRCGRKDDPSMEVAKICQYAQWLQKALEGCTINPRV